MGLMQNRVVITSLVETTSKAFSLDMKADRSNLKDNSEDVSVITVQVKDVNGCIVPTADDTIVFNIQGPGEILGVGNGDPASHEPDKYVDKYSIITMDHLRMKSIMDSTELKGVTEVDDSTWTPAFIKRDSENRIVQDTSKFLAIKGDFQLKEFSDQSRISFLAKRLVENQSLFVNGILVAQNGDQNHGNMTYILYHKILRKGKNSYLVTGVPFVKKNQWEALNTDPGVIQIVESNGDWKRSAFNGLLQVIVKSKDHPGDIILKAFAKNLRGSQILIHKN